MLPKYLIFLGTWRITVQSPDAEGLIKAKEALAQGQNTEYGETIGGWYCQVPCYCSMKLLEILSEMLPTLPPALSFPKHALKNRELQSPPFPQVAERSTIITDKRAVFSLFMPHMDPATSADTRGHL